MEHRPSYRIRQLMKIDSSSIMDIQAIPQHGEYSVVSKCKLSFYSSVSLTVVNTFVLDSVECVFFYLCEYVMTISKVNGLTIWRIPDNWCYNNDAASTPTDDDGVLKWNE